MKKPTEAALIRAVLQYLTLRDIVAWRNNTQGTWDAKRGVFRAGRARRGVSDVLGVLEGGRFLAVECKMLDGRLTTEQQQFLDDVNLMGGLAVCVRSLADLEEALRLEGVR